MHASLQRGIQRRRQRRCKMMDVWIRFFIKSASRNAKIWLSLPWGTHSRQAVYKCSFAVYARAFRRICLRSSESSIMESDVESARDGSGCLPAGCDDESPERRMASVCCCCCCCWLCGMRHAIDPGGRHPRVQPTCVLNRIDRKCLMVTGVVRVTSGQPS